MKVKVDNSETGSFSKGFIPLIRHQASEIREGGWLVLMRKLRTFLRLLPLMLPTVPILLIVRILRPVVLIRFGALSSEHIGHLAGNTEMYLCRRDAGMDNPRAFDIFYYMAPAPNQQLKKMWDRTLHISSVARYLYRINLLLPGGETHQIPLPLRWGDFDVHGLMNHTPVHLCFTPEEERRGREMLQAMGVPEGAPFICFLARDSAYYKSAFPDVDADPSDLRNSSIHDHIPAAEEMTRRGSFAIRMGAAVNEPLQTTNPMIIDYATRYRSDFTDIYLGAKCLFYIGDQSGFDAIPVIFRKPVATVNLVQIQRPKTWSPDGLFITKKLWLQKKRRFMTFREIFDPKKIWLKEEQRSLTFLEIFEHQMDGVVRSIQFEQLGIDVVANTPEEITALAVEMDERLKGTWQTTEEDEELQRRFWSIFRRNELFHGEILSHIGAEFLRQNRNLLE